MASSHTVVHTATLPYSRCQLQNLRGTSAFVITLSDKDRESRQSVSVGTAHFSVKYSDKALGEISENKVIKIF
jgi:hypothetical protein